MRHATPTRLRFSCWFLMAAITLLLFGCADPAPAIDSSEPFGPLAPPSTNTPSAGLRPGPPSGPAPRPPTGEPEAATLAILYTNDARGYLDPCG